MTQFIILDYFSKINLRRGWARGGVRTEPPFVVSIGFFSSYCFNGRNSYAVGTLLLVQAIPIGSEMLHPSRKPKWHCNHLTKPLTLTAVLQPERVSPRVERTTSTDCLSSDCSGRDYAPKFQKRATSIAPISLDLSSFGAPGQTAPKDI